MITLFQATVEDEQLLNGLMIQGSNQPTAEIKKGEPLICLLCGK